ncbi:MAG: MFS transporter [Clostridiales bacterium]|nr:MFS transporter [Clostridiales bacterium]
MNSKLSMGTKLGYSVGQVAISAPYNLVGVFLLFFYTNIAGVEPALAGTVFSIAVLWAAVADPFIGNFSDNLRTKYGRRRPMLLIVAIPLAVTTWLLFTTFDFDSEVSKNAYYIILAIVFYTVFTFTEVPFYSLGAEITNDYDERAKVRVISSMFIYVAVLIAVNLPTFIVGKVTTGGGTLQSGWSIAAAACGIIAIITIFICWTATKGKELIVTTEKSVAAEKVNVFKAFVETLKIKPVKFIVLANLLFLLGMSIVSAMTVYVLNYVACVDVAHQSIVLSVLPVATIVWLPVINFLAPKLGKKKAYIVLVGIAAVACVVFFIIGIYTFVSMCVFNAIFALGNGSFWTLCFAMAYDTTEVDEFVNGTRREGILVAYMSFAQKVGTAGSTLLIGLVLQYVQYDGAAAEQTSKVVDGLVSLFTWIPAIFIGLSVVSVCLYPITQKKHKALLKALEQKKAGQEYSTEGFEDLL